MQDKPSNTCGGSPQVIPLRRHQAGSEAARPQASIPSAPQAGPPSANGGSPRTINGRRPKPCHDYLKFADFDSPRKRKIVAIVASCCAVLFFSMVVLGSIQQRLVAPVSTGSWLILEALIVYFPQAYLLGTLHNAVLCITSLAFVAAVSSAHAEPPGDPRKDGIYVWRRAVPFVAEELLLVIGLFALAWFLRAEGWPILGAIAVSNAFAILLEVLARVFVPIARPYLVAQFDLEREGLANTLIVGGGLSGLLRGAVSISHKRFRYARGIYTSPLEWACGLQTLEIVYVDIHDVEQRVRLRCFGSIALVEHVANVLNKDFRLGRWEQSLMYPIGHPMRTGSFPHRAI